MNDVAKHSYCPSSLGVFVSVLYVPVDQTVFRIIFENFFPPNAFLRRRRKKALLRVNDRGGGWKMCILALCRVYVTCARAAHVCS